MAMDPAEAGQESSGGGLRAQLEATLADNKAMKQLLANTVASNFLHVKAEDFDGISPHQYATHAAELEAKRVADRDALLREAILARGVPEGDLDSVLSQLGKPAEKATTTNETPASRVASLSGLGGAPVTFDGKQPETDLEWIKAGLRQADKQKS